MNLFIFFCLASVLITVKECSYIFNFPKDDGSCNGKSETSSSQYGSGVNYIRFGHAQCPDYTQIVYSGYIGGSHYQHPSGTDYLCLPKEGIEWPVGAKAGVQGGSFMYGTEFEWQNSIDSLKDKHDSDVLCALCDATGQSQHVMIPGRRSCPSGWRLEYSGLLMSSHKAHSIQSSFICVDTALEVIDNSAADINGALLYIVEARCKPLPCPPYEEGKELACVVCTQ